MFWGSKSFFFPIRMWQNSEDEQALQEQTHNKSNDSWDFSLPIYRQLSHTWVKFDNRAKGRRSTVETQLERAASLLAPGDQ